jgi:hypothetical protein
MCGCQITESLQEGISGVTYMPPHLDFGPRRFAIAICSPALRVIDIKSYRALKLM